MRIDVLKTKETLSAEEALNIKGGLTSSFETSATECTCDCFISNKNEEKPKPKKSVKSINK